MYTKYSISVHTAYTFSDFTILIEFEKNEDCGLTLGFEDHVAGSEGGGRLGGQVRARGGGRDAPGGPGHHHVLGAAPERVVHVTITHLSNTHAPHPSQYHT